MTSPVSMLLCSKALQQRVQQLPALLADVAPGLSAPQREVFVRRLTPNLVDTFEKHQQALTGAVIHQGEVALNSVHPALPVGQKAGVAQLMSQLVRPVSTAQSPLFWAANGLTYLPAAIVTPIVTQKQLKASPDISPRERHLLVQQEISRQLVGATIHFANYYPAVFITNGLRAAGQRVSALRGLEAFLGMGRRQDWANLALVTVMNTLGYGLLRPTMTNTTLLSKIGREGGATAPHHPLPTLAASGPPTATKFLTDPTLVPPTPASSPVAPSYASSAFVLAALSPANFDGLRKSRFPAG